MQFIAVFCFFSSLFVSCIASPTPDTAFLEQQQQQPPAFGTGKKCSSARSGIMNYEAFCSSAAGRVDGCSSDSKCELDPCHFWKHVGRQRWVIVLFYAPWCALSQDFMEGPWRSVTKSLTGEDVLVAQLDASKHQHFAYDNWGVDSFPVMRLFPAGCYTSEYGCLKNSTMSHEIPGRNESSTDETVARFIISWVGHEMRLMEEGQKHVLATLGLYEKATTKFRGVELALQKSMEEEDTCKEPGNGNQPCELNYDNFYKHVGRQKWFLVFFYAPWCPFSAAMCPVYDRIRALFSPAGQQSKLNVGKIDGDKYSSLGNDFNVTEFPMLKLFPYDCYWRGGCWVNTTYTFEQVRVDEEGNEMDDQQYAVAVQRWANKLMGEWEQHPLPEPVKPKPKLPPRKPIAAETSKLLATEHPNAMTNVVVPRHVDEGKELCKFTPDPCADESKHCDLVLCHFWKHVGREKWAVVQMYADWCAFDLWKPVLEELKTAFASDEDVLVSTLNAGVFTSLADDYNVTELPSLLLFPAGCYDHWEGCHRRFVRLIDTRPKHHKLDGTLDMAAHVGDITTYVRNIKSTFKMPTPEEWQYPNNWQTNYHNTIPMPEVAPILPIPSSKLPPGQKTVALQNQQEMQQHVTSLIVQGGEAKPASKPRTCKRSEKPQAQLCHVCDEQVSEGKQ